ncbi:hypothetical protein FOI67_17475, partial [Geobacillus sp. LEMMJ02]
MQANVKIVRVNEADFVAALPRTTHAVEEPMFNLHPVAKLLLAEAMAADGVEVAITGDGADQVLRPAILWNDTRAGTECVELEALVPESRAITGNMAMPGFTAPKPLLLAKYEPAVFRAVHKVLLPKDYLIWRLSGEFVSEMSDASGTLWL